MLLTGTTVPAVVTALETALTTVSGDMQTALTTIAPIALAAIGGYLVIRFGYRVFRSITGR